MNEELEKIDELRNLNRALGAIEERARIINLLIELIADLREGNK
tara:strand:+ start:1241 stop:1372 length:132 start_codon:yes stop_codon:yes gene_type:complete